MTKFRIFRANTSTRMRILFSLVLVSAILSGLLLIPATTYPVAANAQAAPGVDDNFYKLAVSQSGMQAVTYTALANAGLPVDTLDPTTFQIYEQGTEVARRVVDADASGTFNTGDYVLFYGRSVTTDFTQTNIYWLTYGVAPGLEMIPRAGAPQGGLPGVTTFLETRHYEQNKLWISDAPMTGVADHWYWQTHQPTCDRFGNCVPAVLSYTLQTSGIATGTYTATLTPRLRGASERGHLAQFYVNGGGVGSATFDNKEEFLGSLAFSQALLIDGNNTLTVTSPYDGAAIKDTFLINWFELSYQRTYTAPTSGQFAFGVDAATPSSVNLANISDPATGVFDISDPLHPIPITGVAITPTVAAAALRPAAGFTVAFAHTLSAAAQYIAAAPGQHLAPTTITLDTPSNLHSPTEGADWIIISHHDFISEAERLAQHRRTWQGYRTAVVDVQDIYDEFNGGLMDQEAIRDFLRYAYENWPPPAPQFVVLLGDGHYDPQNFMGSNFPTFIPPYLAAVDPFEGLTAADNRYVAYDPAPPVVNPVPFMSLGRLAANTLADAQAMVDKIISYETNPPDPTWASKTVFVADNPDYAGDFQANSNVVADNYSLLPVEYSRQKIFYEANTTPSLTTDAIVDAINSGALLVNYHGHASWRSWAAEGLWQVPFLSRLTNLDRYPIVLVMGCLEGYFIVPLSTLQSLGESIVRLPNAGAVASWSPAGKGVAAGHDVIFQAFYEAVFNQGLDQIGLATNYAKQALADSTSQFKDLIDTYILFGDPAMPLNLVTPDLWVQKRAEPSGQWRPGEQASYVLTYGNSGTVIAGDVVLTDVIPSRIVNPTWVASAPAVTAIPGQTFAWQLPDLSPSITGVITVTGTVDPSLVQRVTISNVVTITASTWESPARDGNNSSRVDTSTTLPTGFALESLQARWTPAGVRLAWAVRNETGVSGYNVYHTVVPEQYGKRINPELIAAKAPPDGSAEYTMTDGDVAPGVPMYYWLEVVGLDVPIWFGPIPARWASVIRVPLVIR